MIKVGDLAIGNDKANWAIGTVTGVYPYGFRIPSGFDVCVQDSGTGFIYHFALDKVTKIENYAQGWQMLRDAGVVRK